MSHLPSALVHICSADEWRRARDVGEHRPDSLSANGFVHLSTPEQVHLPANRLYAGRTDLVLLSIDPARLSSPVRWEPGAVINVTPYLPDGAGRFRPLAT
jgi:uncharacterized protein (DUF952 family)